MKIKKLIACFFAMLIVLSLCCCGIKNSANFKQGISQINSGDYKAAEKSLRSAVQSGYTDDNAETLLKMITDFNKAQNAESSGDYEGLVKILDGIPKLYKDYPILEDDMEELFDVEEAYNKAQNDYNKAFNYYTNDLSDDARTVFLGIDDRYLSSGQKENITKILKTIDKAKSEADSKQSIYPEVQTLMENYTKGLEAAVNNNAFSYVSHTLLPGSMIYQTQKNFVEEMNNQRISETFDKLTIESVEWISDTICYIETEEVATFLYANGSTEKKNYEWKYTATISDGALLLTEIQKN